jgi:quercetin dioxygenase-like cupin family protein
MAIALFLCSGCQTKKLESSPMDQFDETWKARHNTTFTAPSVRINDVLANTPGLQLRFTGAMLWDAEVRKALDPARYVPSIFESSRCFGRKKQDDGSEILWRVSQQRAWKTGELVTVVEHVHIDPARRIIHFLGERHATDEGGRTVTATDTQPLFNVEHSVAGNEDAPVVAWRIVHLTEHPDPSLVEVLRRRLTPDSLPEYVAVYLRERLAAPTPQSPRLPLETPATEVDWQRPFGLLGPEMASVWGDAQHEAHGSLLRFPAAHRSGLHTHPFDSWGVVLEGELTHAYPGRPPGKLLGPGGWYFEPAGMAHESICGERAPCVVLVFNPGRFGFVLEQREEGPKVALPEATER